MNPSKPLLQIALMLVGFTIAFEGCTHQPVKPDASPVPPKIVAGPAEPIKLQIHGEKGRVEVTRACTLSVTKSSEKGELRLMRSEETDFTVKTTTVDVSSNGHLAQITQTTAKEGTSNLHDLAYPELGEVIAQEIKPNTEVVKIGNFRKDSLFYVPSLPLPDHPVKEKDSWSSVSHWKADENNVMLTSTIHATWEKTEKCGTGTCAVIAVAGTVTMPSNIQHSTGFNHKLSGTFLFELNRGLVPWSEVQSDEDLGDGASQVRVHSNLRTELAEPAGYRVVHSEEPGCPFGKE